MSERYAKSEAFLARAQRTIPLGSQTFSKSKTQYPFGVSPYFVTRGKAAHVWDVDGNEYVDFINALCAVTLGYDDADVTSAVRAQLDDGVIFSLPHPLETEVAERICDIVPCAEMVRFGKNGSDATAGAIRVARAYTGRDRVAVCGYHGWQDWYIGTTARNRGVPQAVRDLSHVFTYNDLNSLERLLDAHSGEFAAVILEPMNVAEPAAGFLQGVVDRAHRHGALVVFDETITGFRFANGGAQELFDVTPDLATFGKGIANGYPLSAVAGRAEVMKLMEEIFFSFTMGGETLSLAAAKATLDKLVREPVVATMAGRGRTVQARVAEVIRANGLDDVMAVSGHPAWSFVNVRDAAGYSAFEIKTLFLQEVFARGVLTLGTHNMSYAHSDADVDRLITAYREVLPIVADAVRNKALKQYLKCEPLQPLFKVR
ncbi:MAG: aminotransferase class III-fold pyridoxal phosphate-dependent enzyme [Gemmatimonas sp.]